MLLGHYAQQIYHQYSVVEPPDNNNITWNLAIKLLIQALVDKAQFQLTLNTSELIQLVLDLFN